MHSSRNYSKLNAIKKIKIKLPEKTMICGTNSRLKVHAIEVSEGQEDGEKIYIFKEIIAQIFPTSAL